MKQSDWDLLKNISDQRLYINTPIILRLLLSSGISGGDCSLQASMTYGSFVRHMKCVMLFVICKI